MRLEESREHRPARRAGDRVGPAGLDLRWLVILGISTEVGILVGSVQGVPAGVLAALITAGALHKIVK